MGTWLEAGVYCEEVFGMSLNTKEGYLFALSVASHCMKMIGRNIGGKPAPFAVLNSLRRNKHDYFGALR